MSASMEQAPAPVNMITTRYGKVRPVCQFCGRVTRAAYELDARGTVGLSQLPIGWAVAPYGADWVHEDGSTGDMYECPACSAAIERGEALTECRDRGRAGRAISPRGDQS